jgi:DNA-binding response OmpR family regulator
LQAALVALVRATVPQAQVDTAADGRTGISMATQEAYDLVVADASLPLVDGFEMVRTLLAAVPQRRIILLTDVAEPSQVGAAAAWANVVAVFRKPPDPDALADAVRTQLERAGDGPA